MTGLAFLNGFFAGMFTGAIIMVLFLTGRLK